MKQGYMSLYISLINICMHDENRMANDEMHVKQAYELASGAAANPMMICMWFRPSRS